jgi:hypothetical protein
MDFRLLRAEYDRETERAYVELRAPDDDGGEAITTAIFSFSTASVQTANRRRYSAKARHLLRRAAVDT